MKSSISHNNYICIFIGAIFLIISIWIQTNPNLDFKMQNLFYDKTHNTWMIQESHFFRIVLYTVPKILLGLVSIALIYLYSKKNDPIKIQKILGFLFCIIFIPTIISFIKSKTNIHCPNDLIQYNGSVPFRSLIDINSYQEFLKLYGNGNCFPGGHASGGYALMSSYFVLDDLYKKSGIAIGFFFGTYMAIYQMMKGAHFLSHILFTIGFSIIIINLVSMFIYRKRKSKL